jgi:uncharacterized protein
MNQQQVVEEIKQRLLAQIKPESIILFGSNAKNQNTEDSDVDLLVVWDAPQGLTNIQRRLKLRDIIGLIDCPLDLLTCTTNELKQAITNPISFTAQVLKEGKIIYDRLN